MGSPPPLRRFLGEAVLFFKAPELEAVCERAVVVPLLLLHGTRSRIGPDTTSGLRRKKVVFGRLTRVPTSLKFLMGLAK